MVERSGSSRTALEPNADALILAVAAVPGETHDHVCVYIQDFLIHVVDEYSKNGMQRFICTSQNGISVHRFKSTA